MSKGKLIELSMINTTSTPTEIVWKLEDEEKNKRLKTHAVIHTFDMNITQMIFLFYFATKKH